MKQSGPVLEVAYETADFAKFPTEIYAKVIRVIITWVIPFAFVAYLPMDFSIKEHKFMKVRGIKEAKEKCMRGKFQRKTPYEKEISKLQRQERAFLEKRLHGKESALNQLLDGKVPPKLQETLDVAFQKAFALVFEKGTSLIEKTYDREKLEQDYKINEYTEQMRQNHKSLKNFTKKAGNSGRVNLFLSGVSGIGLGVLGIGIPDIVLFISLLLKGLYEISLNYGFSYESEEEKKFLLLLIQGALSKGEEVIVKDEEVNAFLRYGQFQTEKSVDQVIEETAKYLSKELLYMKFLQGIPIAGAVGGAYDVIYTKQVMKYGELKYRRRFLEKKKVKEEQYENQ